MTTPKRPKSNVRQRHAQAVIRLLPAEREQIAAAAARQQVSVSEFMRRTALSAAVA